VTARRFRLGLGAITALGLALRVAWVQWATRQPRSFFLDPSRYLGYAQQIADGNGMVEGLTGDPTAYYPPGYPWFLGVVVWASRPFTDEPWMAGAMVQAVLGAVSIVLVAYVTRRLAGRTAALVAAAVFALYPNLIFHTGVLLGETLYNTLFLAFLAVVLSRPWGPMFGRPRVFAAGVLLGSAVLVRPISLAVIPVVVLCWVWAGKDWSYLWRWGLVLVAGVAVCIVPWTIRNAVRMEAFVPISTNTGDNLCIGHGDGATGAFQPLEYCDVPYPFMDGKASELAADEAKQRLAREGFVRNIEREPYLLWARTYYTWFRDGDHDALFAVQEFRQNRWMARETEARLIRVADAYYWAVGIAGVVGLVALVRRREPEGLLLVGCAVMTALVPLAFFGDARFKVPVIPLLIIAAACLVRRRDPDPLAHR
jgi:4-amino-4-deoxy-L-arabinose transferase-like glycosyltransferase